MNVPSFLRRRREISLLVLLSLTSAAAGRPQQELKEQPKNDTQAVLVPALGMEGFRYILHRRGLQPVATIGDADDQTVIVVLGSMPNFLNQIFPKVRKGASLLVATDSATELTELGVRITGERVQSQPAQCYLGNINFPFVDPYQGTTAPDDLEKVFRGFSLDSDPYGSSAIATNEPSVLKRSWDMLALWPLARYPEQSYAAADGIQLSAITTCSQPAARWVKADSWCWPTIPFSSTG